MAHSEYAVLINPELAALDAEFNRGKMHSTIFATRRAEILKRTSQERALASGDELVILEHEFASGTMTGETFATRRAEILERRARFRASYPAPEPVRRLSLAPAPPAPDNSPITPHPSRAIHEPLLDTIQQQLAEVKTSLDGGYGRIVTLEARIKALEERPSVTVTNNVPPAQVSVILPPRKTETVVERDANGELTRTTSIQTDL